jgi:hypothetical protein
MHGNADDHPCISGRTGYVNRRARRLLGAAQEPIWMQSAEHPDSPGDYLIWQVDRKLGYKIAPKKGQRSAHASCNLVDSEQKMRVEETGEAHPETNTPIYLLTPVQ